MHINKINLMYFIMELDNLGIVFVSSSLAAFVGYSILSVILAKNGAI